MDTFADERDFKLLSRDKYTFSVMSRIIKEECELRLSDHERLIICFTGQPYPVWIWTPDNAPEDEMERAYKIAKDNSFMDGELRTIQDLCRKRYKGRHGIFLENR